MTTVLALQRALLARGYDIGTSKDDGHIGPATLGAAVAAVNASPKFEPAPAPVVPTGTVPLDWMPFARMERVIVHWTAGGHKASATDRKHYHILIEGDGKLVRGDQPVTANAAPIRGVYAAHTLNCNTGSIGVSLCGMAGAIENPFSAGRAPITMEQWGTLASVLSDLCRRYSIPVTKGTVLSHAEVQPTLKITQRGKWDISRLPFDPGQRGADKIGDSLRAAVKARL